MSSARLADEQIPGRAETGSTLLKALFGHVVFSVGNALYNWEDVVLAAELSGDWARLRERTREGLACLRRMEAEESPLGATEIESAANEFRYARDLVSAGEMEEWLARWGLTAESWMDYVRSSLLRQKWSADLADLVSEQSPSDEEVEDRIQTEAACSGELRRLAYTLAGRAAVAAREAKEEPAKPGSGEDTAPILGQFPAGLREAGLPGIPFETCRAKMESLARLELSFGRVCESAVTSEAVKAQIRSGQTDWTRLDCQCVSFPDEEAAREAALCVREDGRTLDEVAGDANRKMRREEIYIEETEPDSRDLFLGARKGELLGPVKSGEESLLYLVLEKVLPSEEDEVIVSRARETVVKRLVEREINDRVNWRWQF
jgi:hypothetical protein